MVEVRMPKFGLTMETGTITRWYKKEGEKVEKGDPLLEVETEKITNNVEAFGEGWLKKILVQEGESAPVGNIIAYIAETEEELISELPMTNKEEIEIIAPSMKETKSEKGSEEHVEFITATPSAKRIAREHKVDLKQIKGTGPGGRITEKDVLDYMKNIKVEEDESASETLSSLRLEISKRLTNTYFSAVLVTNVTKVDFTNLLNIRNSLKSKVSISAIIAKVVAETLKEFKKFNAHFDGEKLLKFKKINIGIATDTERGLMVPVLKDAGGLSVFQIDSMINRLAELARAQQLTLQDVQGSHFTITNLGIMRTDWFTPIINGQEVAILGVGRTTKEVTIDKGKIFDRYVSYFSLSYDHRIIDGAEAARFLDYLASFIEEENKLKNLLI